MTTPAARPTPPLDLLAPQTAADPYPIYHALRSQTPVCWSEPLGCWLVTRHDDALAMLCDPVRFESRLTPPTLPAEQDNTGSFLRLASRWLLFQGPPRHTAERALVQPLLAPPVVAGVRPTVAHLAHVLLDGAAAAGKMDLLWDFACPLAARVLATFLCSDPDDRERVAGWCRDIARANAFPEDPETHTQGRQSVSALTTYLEGRVRAGGRSPAPDFVSGLLTAERRGQPLDAEGVSAQCLLMLLAGVETTQNLIANGVLALLRHPECLRQLGAGATPLVDAVEELLRYDSPVQGVSRQAAVDVTLRGGHIREGDEVVVLLGAANRDPQRFPDPDRLDLCRRDNRHLAFGAGPHFCLGAALARLEAQIAVEVLLDRLPRLRLADEPVRWRAGNLVARGPQSLPVLW